MNFSVTNFLIGNIFCNKMGTWT